MAQFTRKMLKAMGIEEDKIDTLIEAHVEVVDALKQERDRYKADAEKLVEVEKELKDAKSSDNYKEKYEAEKKAFEAYKNEQTAKAQKAAKEAAAKTFFESKGITGANLEIAMKGAKDEIASLELDGENIKDNKVLADLVSGTYAGLVVTQQKKGVDVAKPPANNGGAIKSREDIYKTDDKGHFVMDASQRQEALAKLMNEQKG